MQKLLQELFERECRNLEFYLKKYKDLRRQYDVLEERIDEIEQNEEAAKNIASIAEMLNSEEIMKEKEHLSLPKNFEEFKKAFSDYKPKDFEGEKEFLLDQKKSLSDFLSLLRENIKKSQKLLFIYVSEADRKGLKFSFPKDNKIAVRVFVLYYSEYYYRDVINVEGCKLDDTFMTAYKAAADGEMVRACEWFEEEAKKYKKF